MNFLNSPQKIKKHLYLNAEICIDSQKSDFKFIYIDNFLEIMKNVNDRMRKKENEISENLTFNYITRNKTRTKLIIENR